MRCYKKPRIKKTRDGMWFVSSGVWVAWGSTLFEAWNEWCDLIGSDNYVI